MTWWFAAGFHSWQQRGLFQASVAGVEIARLTWGKTVAHGRLMIGKKGELSSSVINIKLKHEDISMIFCQSFICSEFQHTLAIFSGQKLAFIVFTLTHPELAGDHGKMMDPAFGCPVIGCPKTLDGSFVHFMEHPNIRWMTVGTPMTNRTAAPGAPDIWPSYYLGGWRR